MQPDTNTIVRHDQTAYCLERRLGKGGFGEVWSASSPDSAAMIALKFLRSDVIRSLPDDVGAEILHRFRRESRNSLTFNHPNVVPTLFVGDVDGTPFFGMPLYDEGDLRNSLHNQKLNSLEIMVGLCRGLQYLHDLGIVHRDIKPQNVLIDYHEPRIADFGLAKWGAYLTSPDSYSITHSDDVLGTIRYMSPEQRRGAKNVDHRTDLYSLGLVFYEIITLNPISTDDLAFGSDPSWNVREQFAYPGIDDIFCKLTAHEPNSRYSSAQEVLECIDQYCEFSEIADRYLSLYRKTASYTNMNWNSFTGSRCTACRCGPTYTFMHGFGNIGYGCITCAYPDLLG